MTAYFDDFNNKLHDLGSLGPTPATYFYDELNALEEQLVWDCTLASSASQFPPELRRAVHVAILKYAVRTMPPNAVQADFETVQEHIARLRNLGSDLHDMFHAVGSLHIPGYTDNPKMIIQAEWINPRDDERALLAVEFGGEHPDVYSARMLAILAEPANQR